ncbi:MAG: hypothetical protein RBR71_02285 [Gudongella sp.]|nr:hypothetical protein [Gudongella sp.]
MKCFEYGEIEKNHLKEADTNMKELIHGLGHINREVNPDIFSALIDSIIGQQISTKAATTVKAKIRLLVDEITPKSIYELSLEDIKLCGMSYRKAEYIKDAADSFLNGDLHSKDLRAMNDKEVIDSLVSIRGVGKWTAEMLLIFSLNRKNILSYDDLGIRRGLMKVYNLDSLTKEFFNELKIKYSPYASIASLYIWEAASTK